MSTWRHRCCGGESNKRCRCVWWCRSPKWTCFLPIARWTHNSALVEKVLIFVLYIFKRDRGLITQRVDCLYGSTFSFWGILTLDQRLIGSGNSGSVRWLFLAKSIEEYIFIYFCKTLHRNSIKAPSVSSRGACDVNNIITQKT